MSVVRGVWCVRSHVWWHLTSPSPCSNSSKCITPSLLVLCKNVQHYILHMGIRAQKPHTIHIIHPTSVIIMNVDIDPNSITASDYALMCTHWKAPDPNKAGKELTLYRCPKEACVSIPTKRFAKCNNNLDGRFVFVNKGSGFTNLKQHLSKCIGSESCLQMVIEAKKLEQSKSTQRLLTDLPVMSHLKTRSVREKVIYDFAQFVVDKGQPLTRVDDEFFRKLVYRSHGVQSISNPVCKKTVKQKNRKLISTVILF